MATSNIEDFPATIWRILFNRNQLPVDDDSNVTVRHCGVFSRVKMKISMSAQHDSRNSVIIIEVSIPAIDEICIKRQ